MAVATGTLRRRKAQEQKVAAKSKRDKMILAAGGVVLVAVLAFELPKVMGGGGSSAPPAPAPTAGVPAPAAAVPSGLPSAAVVSRELRAIAKLPAKDPFHPQLGTVSGPSTPAQPAAKAPRVRTSHFVLKNPFKAQLGAPAAAQSAPAPLAAPPVVTPTKKVHKSSTSSLGYIVILRSLDTRASAERAVRTAHAHGLSSASVLYSSKYTTLRHGWWVVYLNKYPSQAAADAGLQQARANGYASAYRRPVKR